MMVWVGIYNINQGFGSFLLMWMFDLHGLVVGLFVCHICVYVVQEKKNKCL